MKYRRKPTVIEAVQFTGHNFGEIAEFLQQTPHVAGPGLTIHIDTLEGVMEVSPNDWVIKGTHGEFYPVKPHIFAANYEPVDPKAAP